MAIICHCEAVRDRTIVKAIHNGATTLDDLRRECGAGGDCVACEQALLDLIAQHAAPTPVGVASWHRHSA